MVKFGHGLSSHLRVIFEPFGKLRVNSARNLF
jgi:hypothetical protein